jgi:hypothetical protein
LTPSMASFSFFFENDTMNGVKKGNQWCHFCRFSLGIKFKNF